MSLVAACIVEVAYVVKVIIIEGTPVYRGSLTVALDLDGDKLQSLNHSEQLDSAVQFQLDPVSRYS